MSAKPIQPTPDELLKAIEEADGTLTVPDPKPTVRAQYRRSLHVLLNSDMLRPIRRLTYKGRDRGDLVMSIVAVEHEPEANPPPEPIPIPSDLRGCHPVVRATRDAARKSGWIDTCSTPDAAHLKVHADSFKRCLLILEAVVTEAERRGGGASVGGRCNGLYVEVNGHSFEVAVNEKAIRIPHELTAGEQRRIDQGYGYGIPQWEYLPTGLLVFRTDHGSMGRVLASDGKRWRLEDRLWRLFEKLEELAAKAEARHQERIRDEQERQARWEAAVDQARIHYAEQYRLDFLERQAKAWRQVQEWKNFLEAAYRKPGLTEVDRKWLTWVEERVASRRVVGIEHAILGDDQPEGVSSPTVASSLSTTR